MYYVRAQGPNKLWATVPINIEICGAETVKASVDTIVLDQRIVTETSTNYTIDLTTLFEVNSEFCKISVFELELDKDKKYNISIVNGTLVVQTNVHKRVE